ncbi:MAG: phosphoribosylamine--glycine ligase [Bacillota bacterium]|jgi:phosphoribosylamine--glycine ligase
MRVLVVGGGGREDALAWKIAQSPLLDKLYCAPGNAGISRWAQCLPIRADDVAGLLDFARRERIDLTVVGPEAPLVLGLADRFREHGLAVFGPSAAAAAIEGSKAYAKDLMRRCGVPTADYRVFHHPADARDYLAKGRGPAVVKADGLAAGKGVVVAPDRETAIQAVEEIMTRGVFGQAGRAVVVEEYLQGEEVSLLALTDGETILPLVSAQDHKRVFDGDQGPNTGGMGAYSPAPCYTTDLAAMAEAQVLRPILQGLAGDGRPYQGVLYAGLMLTEDGPRVLEFNCRFGDPETQAVLPRLRSDLLETLWAVTQGELDRVQLQWDERSAVCVVLAAPGYPGDYPQGLPITGLDEAAGMADVQLFYAGTACENGKIVTAGGRVLGVTALGDNITAAVQRVYQAVEQISFPGVHYRRDIAARALRRSGG